MKLKIILLGALSAAIALTGCDVITNPIVQKQHNSSLPARNPDFIDSSSTDYNNTYKILLEDYMGHTCSNCPPAVAEGETLRGIYGNQLVLMEIHNGNYADTVTIAGVPDSAFRKDYKCEAGDVTWRSEFKINQWPWGMVNRMGYVPSNSTFIFYTNWQDSIINAINANPTQSVAIDIHDSCWVTERLIGVEFQTTFKKSLPGTYVLETAIVEDSIVDWQTDANSSSGYDTNFVHHNVLRGSFDYLGNGTTITNTSLGNTWTSYQTYDFNKGENGKAAKWNMGRCYIVAFVYNSTTKAVVQAEMIKVE